MNLIQQIAGALSCMAICLIIHFSIRNWRTIAQELGYSIKEKATKVNTAVRKRLDMSELRHRTSVAAKILKGEWVDS